MSIVNWLNNYAFGAAGSVANPILTKVMSYWTESFYVVLILAFAYLYFKRDKNAVPFATALVILFILSEILKYIFKEPRPCADGNFAWVSQVACESGYAFPSSHALSLTGLVFFLKNFKYVQAAYIVWLVIILFSRVYLGQHYLTDVIAGVIISIIVGYVIYKYENYINNIADKVFGLIPEKWRRMIWRPGTY